MIDWKCSGGGWITWRVLTQKDLIAALIKPDTVLTLTGRHDQRPRNKLEEGKEWIKE